MLPSGPGEAVAVLARRVRHSIVRMSNFDAVWAAAMATDADADGDVGGGVGGNSSCPFCPATVAIAHTAQGCQACECLCEMKCMLSRSRFPVSWSPRL